MLSFSWWLGSRAWVAFGPDSLTVKLLAAMSSAHRHHVEWTLQKAGQRNPNFVHRNGRQQTMRASNHNHGANLHRIHRNGANHRNGGNHRHCANQIHTALVWVEKPVTGAKVGSMDCTQQGIERNGVLIPCTRK